MNSIVAMGTLAMLLAGKLATAHAAGGDRKGLQGDWFVSAGE
jgi:hypothetical protein